MCKNDMKALNALAGVIVLAATLAIPAQAATKELSDRSVKVLMRYAWTILPEKFTSVTGKVIEVDKTKKDDIMVPLDTARRVVKVGRLSAHAQICDEAAAQSANYQALMRSEEETGKWSDQQLLYISQLHLFTVMWLSGNVKLVEKDGSKDVVINQTGDANKQSCTDEERNQVAKLVGEYVCKTYPKLVKDGCE